jgi:hypothetical protein
MSDAQFNKAGRKCPKSGDTAILFDSPFFKGRQHHIGFLPRTLQPCCFRKPGMRYVMGAPPAAAPRMPVKR